MKRSLGLPVVATVVGGVLVAGACQPRRSFYQDSYEDYRVISPRGVSDGMALYRIGDAPRRPEAAPAALPALPAEAAGVRALATRSDPSVVVADRSGGNSALNVEVITPGTALICEDIPVRFLVTNTSGEDARDAVVQATLPAGLRASDGSRAVSMNVGLVPAGGTREIVVPVRAEQAGSFLSLASVSGDPDIPRSVVETAMVVGRPTLSLSLERESSDGGEVVLKVRVANTGNVEALDTTVTATLSPDARTIDRGGAVESRGQLTWNFGAVMPGETREARVRVDERAGAVTGNATASARCAEAARASLGR